MKILFLIDSMTSGGKERRLTELMKRLAGYPDISFDCSTSTQAILIKTDRKKMRRVLTNLLDNSVRALLSHDNNNKKVMITIKLFGGTSRLFYPRFFWKREELKVMTAAPITRRMSISSHRTDIPTPFRNILLKMTR